MMVAIADTIILIPYYLFQVIATHESPVLVDYIYGVPYLQMNSNFQFQKYETLGWYPQRHPLGCYVPHYLFWSVYLKWHSNPKWMMMVSIS